MANQNTPEASPGEGAPPTAAEPKKAATRKKLLWAATVVIGLSGIGATYATGLVGKLSTKEAAGAEAGVPGSVDLPEIVANLNTGPRKSAFVRIKARLELASKADEPVVLAAQPKMQDLFQTYLRDMRPEELRGSAGTYRLREELIARANIAVAPARVTEILFVEMLVQ